MTSRLTSYQPELETFEGETESPVRDSAGIIDLHEMDLAIGLLEVRDEHELGDFVDNIVNRVSRALNMAAPGSVSRAVGSLLAIALQRALTAASGTGTPAGARSSAAALGSRLTSISGSTLGLELEGLSHEDQEFEKARQLIRFVVDAVTNAVTATRLRPVEAARAGVLAAARRHAPGLLQGAGPSPHGFLRSTPSSDGLTGRSPPAQPTPDRDPEAIIAPIGRASGRWVRTGPSVIVFEP